MFNENMFITKSKDVEWKTIGNEAIVLSPNGSTFFELNETATFIWKNINGKNKIKEIVEKVVATFDINECKAHIDVKNFLIVLLKKKLIEYKKRKKKMLYKELE